MTGRDGNDPYRNVVMFSPGARNLVRAIFRDEWPSVQAMTEFGIKSQEHYLALYYPIRNGEIGPGDLEAALYNGPKLTELVNSALSNPHKGIAFETSWDRLPPEMTRELRSMNNYREGPAAPLPEGLDWVKDRVGITVDLVEAFQLGTWPSQVTMKAFHISSTANYWSLCGAFQSDDITFEQLTNALGNGERLAELANTAPTNVRCGRTFQSDGPAARQANHHTAEPDRHLQARVSDREVERER